jgi:predicted nucleic acid-binding protein
VCGNSVAPVIAPDDHTANGRRLAPRTQGGHGSSAARRSTAIRCSVASDPAAIRPATLVDSCVLLDVITGDERWADWSAGQIETAIDAGRVVINPIIYAEVSVSFQTFEELDEVLPASDYEREPLPYLAGFAAGKAVVRYRRGGDDKRSPMPDFYIGAHAAVAGYQLLTRDARRYRTSFPTIQIIAPAVTTDEPGD